MAKLVSRRLEGPGQLQKQAACQHFVRVCGDGLYVRVSFYRMVEDANVVNMLQQML